MKKGTRKNNVNRALYALSIEQNIETQTDLVEALMASGIVVTQATVSRDIKELGIVKVMTGEGTQKYVTLSHSGEVAAGRMRGRVFSERRHFGQSIECFVIMKTLPGMGAGRRIRA